ncbi:MAG TPA: glutamate racemase [Ktedonobacteraceae bacterium]|nr:glutamate racemase [Ktedonobacteraceae bacterium]
MWDSESETEAGRVHPARDSERSDHSISDYSKDDPRSYTDSEHQALTKDHQHASIGVFDSGAGGLTVLLALQQELPNENYIYFGDTAHIPYGKRTEADISELTQQAIHFLIEQGVKLVVVACNTASQVALSTLRATFSIPFVGVVPAVKPAARATKRGRIGITATDQAIRTRYLHQLIEEFASDVQVYAIGCPELVTLVERGEVNGPMVEEAIRQNFQLLLSKDVDVIVLGCTHFPALRSAIECVVGKHVQVIDSGAAIARRTRTVLDSEGLMHPSSIDGTHLQIWCSGDPASFSQVASKILGYPVIARQAGV